MRFFENPKQVISIFSVCALIAGACGGSATVQQASPEEAPIVRSDGTEIPPAAMKTPPASAEPRDIKFPPMTRFTLDNGLEVNVVEHKELPVVHFGLMFKSGSETDPARFPGLADLVAKMLKEGTTERSGVELAEAVALLGADLWTSTDDENSYVTMRALSDKFAPALAILGEVVMQPAFDPKEVVKLLRREKDRLTLSLSQPRYLASREVARRVYGPKHPYAMTDTTLDALKRMKRTHFFQWRSKYFVPNNAVLVVVGDVSPDAVKSEVEKIFTKWKKRTVKPVRYPELPKRESREIVLLDVPEAEQSIISIVNPALKGYRKNEDFIPFTVANQVLGGSAASRLFMDLREKRSLTYGAYSWLSDGEDVDVFTAYAQVRNEVTGAALDAFFEHLERITKEPPSEEEIDNAHRFLSDSFPLKIDTPRRILSLIMEQRALELEDDYWDSYRSAIREVSKDEAFEAATEYIHPDRALVVVVGRAADVAGQLTKWGPVTVIDKNGKVQRKLEATTEGDEASNTAETKAEEPAGKAAKKPAGNKEAAKKEAAE